MMTGPPPRRPTVKVPGLRSAFSASLLLTVVAVAAALLLGGRPQLNGVVVGVALVVAFFLFGTVSTSLAAAYAPGTALVVALCTYTSQVVLLGVGLAALHRSGLTPAVLDPRWLAGTVIAGTLCWTSALIVDAIRSQQKFSQIGTPHR